MELQSVLCGIRSASDRRRGTRQNQEHHALAIAEDVNVRRLGRADMLCPFLAAGFGRRAEGSEITSYGCFCRNSIDNPPNGNSRWPKPPFERADVAMGGWRVSCVRISNVGALKHSVHAAKTLSLDEGDPTCSLELLPRLLRCCVF